MRGESVSESVFGKYIPSPEAKAVFRKYNISILGGQTDLDAFLDRMKKAQVELIRIHFDDMDDTTKQRAKRTVNQLGYSHQVFKDENNV